jgi:hypothetical protein
LGAVPEEQLDSCLWTEPNDFEPWVPRVHEADTPAELRYFPPFCALFIISVSLPVTSSTPGALSCELAGTRPDSSGLATAQWDDGDLFASPVTAATASSTSERRPYDPYAVPAAALASDELPAWNPDESDFPLHADGSFRY